MMTTHLKPLKLWVLGLVLATAGLLVWHEYGMNKVIVIDADTPLKKWVYADNEQGGGSSGSIIRQGNELVLTCQYSKTYAFPYCGFMLGPGPGRINFDLTGYDRFEINLATSKAENPIRIFIHTFDDEYSNPDDVRTFRVHELHYNPKIEGNPFVATLEKFQVAMWWVNEFQVPPDKIRSDFKNVVAFAFGLNESEAEIEHKLYFRSMRFMGKWMSYAQLQLVIIMLWVVSAALYLTFSFTSARRAVTRMRMQKKVLVEINAALELERKELETLATRDTLTGVYNRLGLRGHLHVQTDLVKLKRSALSLLFIDIDNFYVICERYGSEIGNEFLIQFCALIEEKTRDSDIFCRWGDDEFLLLCEGTSVQSALIVAEKIRVATETHQWPLGIKVSCTVGVAEMNPEESIGDFIRRADNALAAAKLQGSNQVKADLGFVKPLAVD